MGTRAKDLPPPEWVETHRDFQLRNIRYDPDIARGGERSGGL
ncbi:hypothetical protein [Streptomyces sp. NBC_00197]